MGTARGEVLHTLGVPVYLRTSLLQASKLAGKQAEQRPQATAEQVKAHAAKLARRADTAPQASAAAQPGLRLSLGMLASSEALVVFDCDKDPTIQRSLMESMLSKCGCHVFELPFTHFRWPIVHNIKIRQGEQEAVQAMVGVARRLFVQGAEAAQTSGDQPFAGLFLVLSGADTRRYFDTQTLLGQKAQIASSNGMQTAQVQPTEHGHPIDNQQRQEPAADQKTRPHSQQHADRVIYLPHSAAKMIDHPELRKQAWQALAPLRAQLGKRV